MRMLCDTMAFVYTTDPSSRHTFAMEPLAAAKWSLCVDSEGRILDQYTIRKTVFHKGISGDIRSEVWLFLLGYYPFSSTSEERKRIDDEKRRHYESLLASWRDSNNSISSEEFEDDSKIIEKDSVRTDRCLEFFSAANIHNVYMLERVMKTYILLRPDIGYVQGMSDILALPLVVLNSEHQAFWCFDFIMKTTQGNVFADLTLSEPLENLAKLCRHIDKPLFDHLNLVYEGDNWLFAYRLILLSFKRELTVEDCSRLWECYWSCHATEHFPLLFTTSVLIHFRDTLLKYSNFEQLMQFSQSLRGKIPVKLVLSQAIELLEQLKSDDYCPYDIKFLVSNQVSAPPPLVGFVRTRQKVTSRYSNKVEIQRHQIWRALFGDAPVQSITSPLMLSPTTFCSETSTNTYNHRTATRNSVSSGWTIATATTTTTQSPSQRSLQSKAPPKMGFVPREDTIHLRDDIRRLQITSTGNENSTSVDESARNSGCHKSESHITGDAKVPYQSTAPTPTTHDRKPNPSHLITSYTDVDVPTTHTIVTEPRRANNGEKYFSSAPTLRTTKYYSSNEAQCMYVCRQSSQSVSIHHKHRENDKCCSEFASNADHFGGQKYIARVTLSQTDGSRTCSKGSYNDVPFDSLRSEADLTCF